ncbi:MULTISPECIES: patatin-like phospholipase family protein [Nocardia]|uniref:patatin-like phospholipase family protein n=1 Tax=Nocardia abscessus TaxID=120957 RepID=UPI0018932512|nr:patatin-like phospholipase family protein [Nocardia abscessus]MBF6476508.1 patatin-like phospholipase family protein [Nocardia abscessus]
MIEERVTVRILAGVAGLSLALMAGMVNGAVDSLNSRRAKILADHGVTRPTPIQPVVLGVSGGAIGAAAAALGMSRAQLRQIAADHPANEVVGNRSLRAMLTKRTLYPDARLRELAHAVVGDRTFADFVLEPNLARRQPSGIVSSLIIPVYSGEHGTLFLPQDLPKLGLTDMPVADALVAATRIPGAFPAVTALDHIFDGGTHHRVPYEVFGSHPALILDLYGPEPHYSRGGLLLPVVHSSLPMIPRRPRPFGDENVCARTIFAEMPYGSALQSPTRSPEELFDYGYDIAATWVDTRTADQLFAVVDPDVLGELMPVSPAEDSAALGPRR